jgi:Arc/MetJ-type ribon-helix-helix transcriptional regulator
MSSTSTIVVNIAMPKEFLAKLDDAAKAAYTSRSDYVRQAVIEKINVPPPSRHADDWLLVDALSKEVSDEELLEVVKVIKNHHSD